MIGPHTQQSRDRISMMLRLHHAAKGVSDDPRKTAQREWYRRNADKINAARREARRKARAKA